MTEQTIALLISNALTEAKRQAIAVTISIVDTGGHLIALQRMEGCSFFALEASQKKAVTASQLKSPTHILADIGQKIPQLQQAFDKNPAILILPGGFPLFLEGKLIGGLGVAGGDFEQDKTVGEAACNFLNKKLPI